MGESQGGRRVIAPALALAIAGLGAARLPSTQPGTSTVRQSATQPATHASTQPAAHLSAAGERAIARQAVDSIAQEYREALRDPQDSPPRQACNYFVDHPAPELSADAVLDAMEFACSDRRETAYVRWQLLSALPKELSEAEAARLRRAYRAAPVPMPRPGISAEDQRKMDQLAQRSRQDDAAPIMEQLERAVESAARENEIILAYREEIYHRLPKEPRTFACAMEDLFDRCKSAADGKELLKALSMDMRAWMASDSATPADLSQLAGAVRRLAEARGPQYYQSIYWSDYNHAARWHKTTGRVDSGQTLKKLARDLDEQSRHPPLKLDIKGPLPKNSTVKQP